MITFKSLNVDGNERDWKFADAKALEDEWDSAECDVPANDDPIWDVFVDGDPVLREATKEKADSEDPVWFEDLLTFLGIDIWGTAPAIKAGYYKENSKGDDCIMGLTVLYVSGGSVNKKEQQR